jgi:hypothetical protein
MRTTLYTWHYLQREASRLARENGIARNRDWALLVSNEGARLVVTGSARDGRLVEATEAL